MRTERPEQEPLANPRSDRVRAVARLSGRSARLRAGRFVVEGPQAVREAVALQVERGPAVASGVPASRTAAWPGALRELYVTAEAGRRHGDIVTAAAGVGVPARAVTDEVLAAMLAEAGTQSPQGLLAVCDLIGRPGPDLVAVLGRGARLVAVLSQVRDPGNAGAVIRAADAAGADAVVLTDASVDVHNPKVVRASAGSLFHLPVVTGVRLGEAVDALHRAGAWVLAADGAGELDLDDLSDDAETNDADHDHAEFVADADLGTDADAEVDDAEPGETGAGVREPGSGRGRWLAGPVGWVFGNEAWGLPDADRALADAVVRVPVHGRAESLNLATAATVCLYATARAQRRAERRARP